MRVCSRGLIVFDARQGGKERYRAKTIRPQLIQSKVEGRAERGAGSNFADPILC